MVHSFNGVLILHRYKKEHGRPLWIYLLWISRIYCQVKNRKYQWISRLLYFCVTNKKKKENTDVSAPLYKNKQRMDKPQTNK